jgi:hypothetical protein
MRGKGVMIAGLPQHFGHLLPNGKRSLWVQDIMTGTRIRLYRPPLALQPGRAGAGKAHSAHQMSP